MPAKLQGQVTSVVQLHTCQIVRKGASSPPGYFAEMVVIAVDRFREYEKTAGRVQSSLPEMAPCITSSRRIEISRTCSWVS